MIKRLLPSSLLGQVMISVALALMVAQVVSFVLLYRAGEERREAAIITQAAFQIINGGEREERRADAARQREQAIRDRGQRRGQGRRRDERRAERRNQRNGDEIGANQPALGALPRPLRYIVTPDNPIGATEALQADARTQRLQELLAGEGIEPRAVTFAIRRAGDDPQLIQFAENRPRFRLRTEWKARRLYVAAIQREPGGSWETSRVIEPRAPRAAFGVLLFQTLVMFGFLIVILFLVLRRITRPLAALTERVSDFSRQPDRVVRLEESGPADTRRLIAAHNAMETRIASMLDEKDVMLGAIGHDLKTPLAALRVRIESVTDDAQRTKMAASIEDITATLDDILALARIGHAIRPDDGVVMEPVDMQALAMSVVEEFEDLGEPVTASDPTEERIVARVQETWAKRALRNLVSNAVRYGDEARISVFEDNGHAVLRIDDKGPGIPPERLSDMMQPFTRGEASRNRATGGAGLGLALARAIAQQHGGALVLSNLDVGLRAELRLPL
ncbi:ATP-binding protein [Erythrobacter sp. Alg231-14]|uniref:ATP-binding protein n=1 Tax=Erythrobacter sp. Alg231-14 TaxID=1922225 RepID=UPI000D55C968